MDEWSEMSVSPAESSLIVLLISLNKWRRQTSRQRLIRRLLTRQLPVSLANMPKQRLAVSPVRAFTRRELFELSKLVKLLMDW